MPVVFFNPSKSTRDLTQLLRGKGRVDADETCILEGNLIIALKAGNRRIVCDVREVPELNQQLILG